ncbi:MAG: DsrE family protein [Caldimicrobium sp.]|jgi:intracellular sulfur oxidation DsrE/DsrF family protein
MLKVLFHVPDSSRFQACLRQVNNLLATISDEPYEIRVLVNFEGIKVVENFAPYEEMFKMLTEKGVKFFFCQNPFKTFGISTELVPPPAEIISSGIRALVDWQKEGFVYIRP